MPDDSLFPESSTQSGASFDLFQPATESSIFDFSASDPRDTRALTPFTQPVFADPARRSPEAGFLRPRNPYDLDPDPTGARTVAWGKRTGQDLDPSYVAGLNVMGRIMGREQLMETETGRQLLHLATLNRLGYRKDFLEALVHGDNTDFIPYVGMIAQVGGSVEDAVTVYDTFKKLQDQEPVTDDELLKTSLYMAQQDRDAHGTWGATVAGIVRQAPAFMMEFLTSGVLAAGARGAAARAGVGGTHLAMTRGAKVLARESVEAGARRAIAKATAKTGLRATADDFAKLAGTETEKQIVGEVAAQLFGYMKSADAVSMYRGFSDDALQAMAKNRAQHEFQKLMARKGGSTLSNGFHSFTQWMGQNVSRGLLDFGSYGTEESTVLFTRQSTAGRALADALGVFAIEAPLKGSVLMIPKKGVEQGVVAPLFGKDGRVVGENQLSLRRTALQTNNRSLMDNAEAIGFGMDLLEYVSENTGRGLGSLLSAAGMGLERFGMRGLVRPMTTAISPAGFALPTEGTEALTVGGKMRQFVQRVFGSRTDYARRVAGQEADLVVKRLKLTGADAEVMRRAVLSGNVAMLRPELRQAVGPDLGRFVQETVRSALQYKAYARYAVAKWMQRHNVGPETVMNLYNQMGYDGVLGEMFEERYSDVVKGLLGLNEKKDSLHVVGESDEEASFFNNLAEAVKGLYPGFSQLTAEAVGFMFPMATRGIVMRAMSSIGGGGELAELRSRLDVIDDALRHNTVGEMTYSDAQAAFEYVRQLETTAIQNLNTQLDEARRVGDTVNAEALEREIASRTRAMQLRAERQKVFFDSVSKAAKNTADALIAVPVDTYGTLTSDAADRAPVLTESEARQVLDAQKALGDFASQLARQLVEGQLPIEGESEHAFRKIARKLIGVAGSLVTGDFSLAAANPAQWTARDMGLSKNVVNMLRDGFREELGSVRSSMPESASAKDVLDETQRRFDLRARQIMTANLAVHQLRSFADGKLREQAAAQWATQNVDADGRKWNYTVDAEGRGLFFKLSSDGASIDESSFKSLADMWADHRDEIEKTRQDILKATIDIMSRRLTGADAGRNAVLAAVTLDRESDMLDTALYDAAMHMIGAQDLVYSVSIDGRTPLKAVMDSRSVGRVSDGVVDFIASKARPEDVKDIVYESVAQSLNLRFNGTAEGLKARNDKIFRMAKLMRLARREGLVFFSKEIFDEDSDAARMSANGTSTLVAKRQADGTYTVDYGARKDDPRQRDVRSFSSLEDVRRAMEADGYVQDEAHTVLTQAKIITSSDMFWMIRELGLAREYYERLGPDRKAEQMHPMLRRGADGKFLNQDDAERILAGELAQAARGAAVDASSADRAMYERLFGDNGYMKVGEKLLDDHGVHKDSRLPYTGEFHDYAPSRYTFLLSAGRISPKSADTYVTVGSPVRTGLASELVDADLTSGLVNALLLHAYSQHGDLLRDRLGNVVSDFVTVVRAAAQEALADADKVKDTDMSSQLRKFLRLCCDNVDRVVQLGDGKVVVKKGTGLTPVGFTILSNAFGLFRAREDATNPMLRAVATIAPRVWASPAFLGFESLLNVTLGGNFLDTAIWNAKPGAKDYFDPALTGVPQVMALANANANALRAAVQSSLPAGMGYEQFLDAVLAQLTAQSKTGTPAASEEETRELRAKATAAAAANADSKAHFSFMGGLISTMKAAVDNNIVVSKSVTDFLASVMEAVANDPRATVAQKQAAAKQLEFMQRRAQVDASQEAYARKVEELSEVQESLRAAEEKVEERRQKVIDMSRADLERESYRPPDLAGEAESPEASAAQQTQETGVGTAPSEAERAAARTDLADAIAERDNIAADLLKKQEAVTGTPVPEGLQALHFGGNTKDEEDLGINADEVSDVEDDGDATVANDPLGMDVPEVFAQEAARREDGFTTEWGRPLEGNGQRLTRRQAKLAAGLVVRSLTDTASEDAFLARLGEMFPHMTEDERQDVLSGFRALDAARLASGRGWSEAVRPGQHFGFEEDEKSDESRSSDNFNERALAEYNSDALKDFTALLRRVAPEANGSIMGFVEMMRGRVRGRAADAPAQDVLTGLLNPQMLPGVENLSQADAQHKKTLKRFGDSDIAAVAESLLSEDPQAAFLVAYLSSLPVNARTRFAGLCAGSVAATPVHIVDGVTRVKSAHVDGKISDMLITASFDRLIGVSAHRLTKLAETLRSEAKTLGVSAFSRTGGLEELKKNAAVVAELLATVTGRNSPLYRAMTSRLAHVAWARMDADQATSLLESVSRTGRGVDVVNTIARALELLAARGGRPTRLDIETTFVAAFTVGQPTQEVNENGKVRFRDDPGLKRAPAHIDKSDPLLTFLNELQAAMPRTMMRAEIDQQREQAAGSVVVAPRGMVPLLSRWLYQEGEGSFTEICRATWPDVSDETLAECRQDGTWPDEARTPVCAKCISSSLTPIEVYRACQDAYGEKGANWVPIYSGDHSSFTLLQVPAEVDLGTVEVADAQAPAEKPTYKSFAKAAYKAIGMHLMFTDTKRSAISSLEAQGTGLVGVDAQGNYGEHRVHIIHSWIYEDPRFTFKRDGRKADKNAAFLGSTFMAGYGAQAVADMSADPESNTKKVHVVGGAGRDLFFIKSLTVSQNGLRGKFREGSAPRAVFDYLEKFRGKKDTLSTDTLTDDDSYKIGPGNSKGLRVVNDGGNTTVMAWVFNRLVKSLVERGELQEGYTNDQLADAFKKYNKLTGDELDELVGPLTVKDNARGGTSDMKLSEIMPGAMVNVFDGWSGPALDLSYREDSAMAYTVANVAHKSNVPVEPGRAPRNYEIDALAMVRTLAAGGWLKTPGLAAQFHELVANWGLLASSVYSDPKFREAMIQLDENLAELRRNGEFISSSGRFSGQHAVEEMARQIMAKTRQAANLPLRGIDAPLVAAGASLDVDGKLIVHTTSRMEAAMLKGSELFTEEEQAFYGANRRLALCNVNVSNNGFRYGWFLAPDAETKYPDAYKGGDALNRRGTNAARRHANAIAWAANEVRKTTDRADADPSEENKKAAFDARKAFASMFVDHHGVGIDKYGDRYLSTYSVEDLFVPSQSDSDTSFDYSAVQCEGQDLVFNDATGSYHVFLGGTMFGLPRTPSYNGSMWLQTVRAGLSVTEEETDDERGWRAGTDAMVSPDPYTNAILGCDHDGDKTKLYMFGVNQNGAVRTASVPAPDGAIIADGQLNAARRSAFVNKAGAAGLLELVRVDDEGNETVVAKDDTSPDAYWRISENARKRVSNSFVRFLFSLSRQLPTGEAVDIGNDVQYRPRPTAGANDAAPRTKFLGGVASSPTKASPVADSESLLKAGLPEILKPDGSAGTLGDPELAMEIATSAMDAGDARGVMVSLARSLHIAWALGVYDGVAAEYKPNAANGLFGPMDGLHWLRCMYHIDGISNATFDDIKEQVCGRLGWTKGMMDAVLTELFLRPGHAPTTDAEFERILKDYASEIRAHGPRYWMLRNSRVDDEEAYRAVALSFVKSFTFRGQVEKKRFSKTSVMDALGLTEERTEFGTVLVAKGSPQTLGDVIGRAVVANGRSALLSQMTRDSGRNSAMGLVYAAVVRGIQHSRVEGLLFGDGALGSAFNVEAKLSPDAVETLDKALAESFKELEVSRWVTRRGLILGMRSFGQSINYLTADPGAPNAATKAGAVVNDFDLSLLMEVGGASRLPSTVAERMNEANQLMYRVGRDLTTVDARAVNASRNRNTYIATLTQTPSTQAREFAGRMLAKDTIAPWNLMRLRSNQQQMPLLAEFFAGALDDVLGAVPVAKGKTRLTGAQVYKQLSYLGENVVGKTHPSTHEDVFTLTTQLLPLIVDEGKKDQMLRTIRTWFTPKVLGARLAIEAFTSICYNMMVTSGEFAANPDNRAAMFIRMSPDNMGLEGLDSGARGRLRRGEAQPADLSLKFGELALGLRHIMPEFRANDRQALDKVRGMFDRVILGQAFTGPRALAGEAAKFTKATSFSISRRSLADYARELAATSVAVNTLEDIKRLKIPVEDKASIEIAWNALGADAVTITPAMLFGALLPAYTLMTARMSGVPDERSTSLLSCLPERYYATLSAAEARRRATDDVVPLLVGSDLAPQTFRRTPEGVVRAADSYALEEGEEPSDEARNRLRGGSGLREYRTDNTSVNTVDIFDPAFEAALGVLRDSAPAVPTVLPKATTASHLRKGGYDANTAKLALAMGSLLGSWATVEYNGGTTFTIRGDLRGDAGTGKAVSIVVDASSNPLLDSEEDVNRLADSSAYAASLTAAVDLGISADDFLLLPKEVRRALVKKYGVGGVTSSKVEWTVGAKGVMTLAGKISIPAGGTKIYHEYFHQMMRMFESFNLFGAEDYAQLEATFGKDPSGRHKFNEEKAAESFRKWVEGNTDKDADSVRTVFQRILDFLKGLLEVLKRGFSYEGGEGEETLFRMMVHGIAQPSTARMAEAQMEATTAASVLLNKLQPRLDRGQMTQDEVDEYVASKEAAVLRNQYKLPKAPKQARTSLEAQAAQVQPVVGETTLSELEELEGAWQIDAGTIQTSDDQKAALLAKLADSGASTAELWTPLYNLVQTRRAMAAALGMEVDLPATADTSDLTVEDDFTVADPVDETADNIRKVTSPLVNNNLFYRTANSIRSALEAGLRETGAWTDDLEYVVRRYSANDAASTVDENLRKRSILHGLRRAMAQVNPEAAQSLANEEIENSLAYRAALVMHQHLESSFLSRRSAGRSPATREGARHASQYNVSAWVLSTDPAAPSAMVADAQARMRELYNASPSGASKAELQLHLDQMDILEGLVGDPTKLSQFRRDQGMAAINEVIGTLRAGTKSAGVDDFGNLNDIAPIDPVDADGNPTTVNPKSQAHLDSFIHSYQDPAVQESLKLALTTAYQVAAMAKYYGELDVHPATAGDIAEAKRLARLNGIPEHMSSAEFLGEHLVGDSNMVDNPAYVDYACQSHFIAQNVDAWLRSMVRDSFGAHEGLGRMMSDEHFEYQGLINAITQKENWIAHALGISLEPGGELLQVIHQKGEYRMENGEVVRRVGDEYIKFDNYGRKTTSVKMTEEDLRRVDMWLKMCTAHANGQTSVVTGVDGLSFYRQLSRDAADYAIDRIVAKRERKENLNPIEWAVWRMTRQVPEDLLTPVHDRFVQAMLSALAAADEMEASGRLLGPGDTPAVHDAATYNSFVVGELVKRGVVTGFNPGGAFHEGGVPRYENAALLLSCDLVDENFRNSDTYKKLRKAGREEAWLSRDFVVKEFMDVWKDTVKFVKRHPWLTHGDGQYFHAFGTALPFWRGSGVFMYNAVRTDRQYLVTPSDKLSMAEQVVARVMASPNAGLRLSACNPADIVEDMDMLAGFIGADHRAAQFLQDVLDGQYGLGERKSVETGVVIPADATYGDIARAFYEKARQLVWDARSGYTEVTNRHVDLENVIARYEDTRLERGEVFGGSTGFKDTDMFRMHGTLPANYEIGHKVHKCIDGITNAMMSRATLANLLLTPEGSKGAPVYYADPDSLAAEASGLPDAFWGNLAEWWQKCNPAIGQVYDPAKSGVANAKAVYAAVRQKHQIEGKPRKAQVGELGYTALPGDDSQLVSVREWLVLDGNGEDFMNATAGGEAMGYLKHFLDAGKVLGLGGAGVRAAIQRALSYSKSLSVSFSFFFPMATRWESPMGAVGAMSTIGSNWKAVGDWMKEHPDAANKIRGMFGGKAWITHDYIGMKDILRMMDSNDPFLAEMYSWAAALGITVSTSVTNPMEPDKTVLLKDIRRMKDALRRSMGADAAGKFSRMMDALLVRQGDKAFNYVLNATKLAVVAQMCMKLRHQAKSRGKAFDPVRDLKKYSRYINAEIGGIDPMQFAWAHPVARQLMGMAMFSWQWTVGAWQAGGGSVLTDMLTGSKTMTRQERAYFAGRWLRMYLGVMIGVPALFQAVTLALAKAIGAAAGGGDDDDDRWGTWQNEDKARWTAFDLTPLLRALDRFDETRLGGLARRLKEGGAAGSAVAGAALGTMLGLTRGGNWFTSAIGGALGAGTGAAVPGLVPLYTGDDPANRLTGRRRYYMHFGKQGWEFFRWFDDALGQFTSKLSMPLQRISEGMFGRNLGFMERALPWNEMGQFERWLSPTTDSALFNIAEAFLPFSVASMHRYGDAGFLPIFGPVQMGASQTAINKRLVTALRKWAANDRTGYRYSTPKRGKKGKPYAVVTDILADARRNGLDPDGVLDKACGQVMRDYYGQLFDLLPDTPNGEFDRKKANQVFRALHRLGAKKARALRSLKTRYQNRGTAWRDLPQEQKTFVKGVLTEGFAQPFDY